VSVAANWYAVTVVALYVAAAVAVASVTDQFAIPGVVAVFSVIAIAATLAATRPPSAFASVVATTLVLLVIAAAGGAVWSVATVLALALLAHAIGWRIAPHVEGAEQTELVASRIALGAGAISYFVLVLGLLGVLTIPAVAVVLAGLAVISFREVVDSCRAVVRFARGVNRTAKATPLGVLACFWAVLLFIETVAPEIQYDALSYHLGLPRVWLAAGRMLEVPEQPQSYYYLGADLNFALAMLFGGQTAARLVSLGFLAVGALALYGAGRSMVAPRVGAVAAMLFVATPAVAWGATTTYVDDILAAYVLLATLAAFRAARTGDHRTAWLAGAFAGLAVATKLTAVIFVVPLAMVVLLARIVLRRSLLAGSGPFVHFAAAATILSAPWPLLRLLQTGNPVFPLLNGVFRSPLWPAQNETFNLREFGIGLDPLSLLRLPIAITVDARPFVEAMSGPVIGLGVLLLPLAFARRKDVLLLPFLASSAIGALVAWTFTAQYLRYLIPALGPLSLLAACALVPQRESARPLLRALPVLIVIAGLPLWFATFWNIPEKLPLGVALGLEPRSSYLARILPTYGALAALALAPDASATRLVLVSAQGGRGDDEDRLYAPGQVETKSSRRAQILFSSGDEETALEWLRGHAVTHVLVNRAGAGALENAAITRASFLSRIGTLEYASGGVELYRLGP
jgi:dolichyl-phosphate-mannose-protein mannosyltransferase